MLDVRVKRLGLCRARAADDADGSHQLRRRRQGAGRCRRPRRSRFSHTARKAIALGAEAIIPGQLYLSEAIARAGVTRIDEVPIVDGLAATVKMAEAMADLKKLGISVTRRGYTHARPPKDVLEQARNFHKRK